jgi:hypothetical protein
MNGMNANHSCTAVMKFLQSKNGIELKKSQEFDTVPIKGKIIKY